MRSFLLTIRYKLYIVPSKPSETACAGIGEWASPLGRIPQSLDKPSRLLYGLAQPRIQ